MSHGEYTCFVCGETYYNESETVVHITRIERTETMIKTIKWDGVICDTCLQEHFGLKDVIA